MTQVVPSSPPALRLAAGAIAIALGAVCCGTLPPPALDAASPVRERSEAVWLHGHDLTVHTARREPPHAGTTDDPVSGARPPLVLYATGDGGWFGTAVEMWRTIAAAGYPVAGFSARAFLRLERPGGRALDVAQVAADYRTLIDDARRALALPAATPVVLAGWSRGAAFSVLAAGEGAIRDDVHGVLAIGLAERENLAVSDETDDADDGALDVAAVRYPFDNYDHLARLTVPSAVIQASGDNYFPAALARRRVGPDTASRRFYAIDARNHRFAGGGAAFTTALADALDWIARAAETGDMRP